MKVSLFKNDTSTFWDEVILGMIVIICLAIGVLLIVFRPAFWIVSSDTSVIFGVLVGLLGVMYFPCLIYRLITNDKKE